MRKYEVSHICAAVVATVGILGVVVASTSPKTEWANENHLTNWIIAVATFAGVFVSGFGLYWLRSTLITNQEMVRVSRDDLEYQIWLGMVGNTPKLMPVNFKIRAYSGLDDSHLTIRVRNDGKSTASEVQTFAKIIDGTPFSFVDIKHDLDEFVSVVKFRTTRRAPMNIEANGSKDVWVPIEDTELDETKDHKGLLVCIRYLYEYAHDKTKVCTTSFAVVFRVKEMRETPEEEIEGNYIAGYREIERDINSENAVSA